MTREKDFLKRNKRFFVTPKEKISFARISREFDIAKERFPVVYGDEQFAKPGTLPDLEALTFAFDMVRSRNPNLVEPSMFLGAWELEREAISMIAEMFNHPNYKKENYNPEDDPVFGWFTDGGTSSILQAAWALRNRYFRKKQLMYDKSFYPDKMGGAIRDEGILGLVKRGILDPENPPVILAPVDMHFAGDKSIDILGLGTNNIIRYDLDDDYRTDYTSLEGLVKSINKTGKEIIMAFVSAGSVDTGRVEDTEQFCHTLKKAWCNPPVIVDAAQQYMFLSLLGKEYPVWDFRAENVEAIIADPHKTDASPYPGSLVVFKDKQIAHDTQNITGYLHADDKIDFDMKNTWQLQPSMHTSRSPIGAIATWAHLLLKGKEKLTKKYEEMLGYSKQIANYIHESKHYKILAPPQTGIISFHTKDENDPTAKQVYKCFEENREHPRFYISYADCIRVKRAYEYSTYQTNKQRERGSKVDGFGGLYIQIMHHTTQDLVDKLIERLDNVGKKVVK